MISLRFKLLSKGATCARPLRTRRAVNMETMRGFAKAMGRDDHEALDSGKKERAVRHKVKMSTTECKNHLESLGVTDTSDNIV